MLSYLFFNKSIFPVIFVLCFYFGRELLERTSSFQTLSAAERYQKFCDEHPGLLQRVNLGCIASYIGIDIATLSRIRKKK